MLGAETGQSGGTVWGAIRGRLIGRTAVFGAVCRGSSPLPGTMTLRAVVLAAGAGTRMKSDLPKPLHEVCGKAMVLHVIDALAASQPDEIAVVVGHGGDLVAETVNKQRPPGPTSSSQRNMSSTEPVTPPKSASPLSLRPRQMTR